MPDYLDILNETYDSNCREIADLCSRRDQLNSDYDNVFSMCRSLDSMLALELRRQEQLHLIDTRIEQLTKGSRKLLGQINVFGIAAEPEPEAEWWPESGLL